MRRRQRLTNQPYSAKREPGAERRDNHHREWLGVPSTVTISAGQSVTVVNNDNRAREIASDPHPVHSNCPQMNALGNIQPGQTRQTNAFPTARSCGFHDHGDPENRSLQGTIVIQ